MCEVRFSRTPRGRLWCCLWVKVTAELPLLVHQACLGGPCWYSCGEVVSNTWATCQLAPLSSTPAPLLHLMSWAGPEQLGGPSNPIHNRLAASSCFTKYVSANLEEAGIGRDRFMGSAANLFFQGNRLRQRDTWSFHSNVQYCAWSFDRKTQSHHPCFGGQ